MHRQALLFLFALSFTPGCVLDIDVLDGVADDTGTDTDIDADAESSSSTTDAETSSSTTDAESSSSTTDAETSSSTTDAETSSSTTDAETSSSTSTSDAPPDCAELELEYDAIVGMTDCIEDTDCKLISGHCSVGLGGCYYAVNVGVDEAVLDTLADAWSNGGCTMGVCDCAPPPDFVVCDLGTCTAG